MSTKSIGSLAGLAGCVGSLKVGQGLAEFSRQLTRPEEYEPDKPNVNWVLPPIRSFTQEALGDGSKPVAEDLGSSWFLPPLQPSNYWN